MVKEVGEKHSRPHVRGGRIVSLLPPSPRLPSQRIARRGGGAQFVQCNLQAGTCVRPPPTSLNVLCPFLSTRVKFYVLRSSSNFK